MSVALDGKGDRCRETLRSLVLTAWQQRWSQHTWTTAIKQALPCGVSGDNYDLATLILELASGSSSSPFSNPPAVLGGNGAGVTLSPLLLLYLRRALCVQLISASSTLTALTHTIYRLPTPDAGGDNATPISLDWVQLDAVLGLVQHVLGVTVPCRGPAPACRQLASSLRALTHWLCRLVSVVTSAVAISQQKKVHSVERMDTDNDAITHHDDDDDDDDDCYDEAACDRSVALLVSVVTSLAANPFLLCLIYSARLVDERAGDVISVDPKEDTKSASTVCEQTLSDMLKELVIPKGVAASRELQLRATIDDLQRVLNFRPERDLNARSGTDTTNTTTTTTTSAVSVDSEAVTPAPIVSPPSNAPGSVSEETTTTTGSDQTTNKSTASGSLRSGGVWASSDRLVGSLLVVEVMCRRASPVHHLATHLLCAARLRCWPDASPVSGAGIASASGSDDSMAGDDNADTPELPLLLVSVVHCVLRTCFQCLVATHDSPLARYWLQFTLLRVPRLIGALCRSSSSSKSSDYTAVRGKAATHDTISSDRAEDVAASVDCVPIVKAALFRLVDSSTVLLDRAGCLYTGDAIESNSGTVDPQTSPSQQQQQQDCLRLLLGQLVKNHCLSDDASAAVKQYRLKVQQQPIMTSSTVALSSGGASTDSPASVLRAEPTVNSILSTMHVQQRQCEQYGASSKFSTVLLHLLGPSQHLVMGAAVAVGLVQRLSRHLLALNQLCSRPLAASSGGGGCGDATTSTLKNQALVFEISFLIVVTTVKNYGRQALPVSIANGSGAQTDSGSSYGGPPSSGTSAGEPSPSGSFLLDWIDEYCNEHGIGTGSMGGCFGLSSPSSSSPPPSDDPVHGQLHLLNQLLLAPGTSVLQPTLHWQLICGRAMPLFVQRLLTSWCCGYVDDLQVTTLVDAACGQYACVAVCLFASVLAAIPHLPEQLARAAGRLLQRLLTVTPVTPSSSGNENNGSGGVVGEHMSERLTLAHDIMRHLLELNRHRVDDTLLLALGPLAGPAKEPDDTLLCDRSGSSQGSVLAAPMLFLHSEYALRVCRLLRSRGSDWLVGALLRRQLEMSCGSAMERCSTLDHVLAIFSVEPVACAVALVRYMNQLMTATGTDIPSRHPHSPHQPWSDSQLQWLASLTVGCVLMCVNDASQLVSDSQSPQQPQQTVTSESHQHPHYQWLSLRLQYTQRRCSESSPNAVSACTGDSDELSVPLWSTPPLASTSCLPAPLQAVLHLLSEQMASAVRRSPVVSPAVRLSVHYIHESLVQSAGIDGGVGCLLSGCTVETISRLLTAQPNSFTAHQLVKLVAGSEPAAASLAALLLCQHRALLVDSGLLPDTPTTDDNHTT